MTQYSLNLLTGFTVLLFVIGCDHDDSPFMVDTKDDLMMSSQTDATSSPTMDFELISSMDANTPTAVDTEVIDLGITDMMLTEAAPMPDMTNIPNYEGPRKKGIAVTHRTYDWSYIVSSLNPFWSYSWGITLSRFQPDGVEFVPMKWSGSMSEEIAGRLQSQFALGEINYLLGYNEPDSETQANMTVDRAITLWSELEAIGIPLISPSPVHFDNEWTEAFMERAMAEGLRIDFLGFHSYAGTNAQGLLNRLDQLYERYGIPIWITEFAVADWSAETRESNRIRPEDVLTFMQTVLPELDRREHIFRYAWYTDFSSQHLWPSALFDADRALTPLGEFYAQHTSNPIAGPPKPYPSPPADPGNLLVNGGFERGGSIGWGGYENRVLDIDHVEPHEGAFSGMLRGGLSSAFDQTLTLEAGTPYTISLHSRWSEPPGQTVGVVIEETDTMNRTSAQLPEDTDWRETTFTVTPAETKEYTFWIWTGENIAAHLYLDTVSIRVHTPNP